ncbi:MAG: hypothetical protein ACKOEP_06940, partial [Phycisphaerales bacterium]
MSAKTEATNPAKLASFLRKHVPAGNALQSTLEPQGMDLVDLFVQTYMLWQAPSSDAIGALKRLKAAFFDWNDRRVSLTSDIADVIGAKYWRAADRIGRMRDAMNGIYRREHKVCLDRLRTLMKKDAVNYMDTLPGMVPFVAHRVLLAGVDFHAVPVDEFGLQMLVQAGALPAGTSLSDAQGWVTRHVKAEEARDAHRALVAAVDHMWATNPPKLPKSASKPAELAPPKPVEEARAAFSRRAARRSPRPRRPARRSPPRSPARRPRRRRRAPRGATRPRRAPRRARRGARRARPAAAPRPARGRPRGPPRRAWAGRARRACWRSSGASAGWWPTC